jgi:pre-rRNA-processing protein TSR1
MPAVVAHSHRPTTKVTHKPFKSKAASKHELRDRAKGRSAEISSVTINE